MRQIKTEPKISLKMSSNEEFNIRNKRVRIYIDVDNNRYGTYYKRYARYKFDIDEFSGSIRKLYHYLADTHIKTMKMWKNTPVKSFSNLGNKDFDFTCINYGGTRKVK